MDAIEAINNRFQYYEELDDEDLINERNDILEEISRLYEVLEQNDLNYNAESEIENSDLPYEKEKLSAVEEIMESRGLLGRSR